MYEHTATKLTMPKNTRVFIGDPVKGKAVELAPNHIQDNGDLVFLINEHLKNVHVVYKVPMP